MGDVTKVEKQYVTHSIALKLFNLGYSEDCMGYFINDYFISTSTDSLSAEQINKLNENKEHNVFLGAPLWQEVIDWFEEKHNLIITIFYSEIKQEFGFKTYKCEDDDSKVVSDCCYFNERKEAILHGICDAIDLLENNFYNEEK